ncbi:Transcriptional activator [Actinomortierella wolfii]|nr:Transcriptional activator [Actinomortierella wolfii]
MTQSNSSTPRTSSHEATPPPGHGRPTSSSSATSSTSSSMHLTDSESMHRYDHLTGVSAAASYTAPVGGVLVMDPHMVPPGYVLGQVAPAATEEHEEPLYVNAKQYHRILKRRAARAALEAENRSMNRGRKYLHESRHKHAMRRPRGPGGRFLTSAEIAAMNATAEKEKSKSEESSQSLQQDGQEQHDQSPQQQQQQQHQPVPQQHQHQHQLQQEQYQQYQQQQQQMHQQQEVLAVNDYGQRTRLASYEAQRYHQQEGDYMGQTAQNGHHQQYAQQPNHYPQEYMHQQRVL